LSEHNGQTDEVTKIELPSSIQQVLWSKSQAAVGGEVSLDVFTHYVGNGSDLEIEFTDHAGKSIAKYKEKIAGNHFRASIIIPDKAEKALYANVELPKHSLKQKSAPLLVLPQIKITNVKWDKKEARRGDILKLTADIEKVSDGTEAEIEIWEHDADEAHDLITKFPAIVENGKVEMEWEYEYHEDTDEIPTQEEKEKYGEEYNPPEYFFTVTVRGVKAGQNQESGLLTFRDWIEILLTNGPEEPISDEPYILYLPDGETIEGKTDNDGFVRHEKIPPGKIFVAFPAYFDLVLIEDNQYKTTKTAEYAPSYVSKDNTKSPVEETPGATDQMEMKPDINNIYESEEEDMLEDEEEIQEYREEDEEDVEVIFSPHILEPDINLEVREDYDVASKHCVSGEEYHLAVIYHLSVELYGEMGEPVEEAVQYQINDQNGKRIFEGISEKQGLIQHSGIGLGYFELIIGGASIWIASVPDLSMKEQVVLKKTH